MNKVMHHRFLTLIDDHTNVVMYYCASLHACSVFAQRTHRNISAVLEFMSTFYNKAARVARDAIDK